MERGDEGFYVQPSWALRENVFAVYRYDYLDSAAKTTERHTVGADWRPMPNLSLKASVEHCNVRTGEDFDAAHISVSAFF